MSEYRPPPQQPGEPPAKWVKRVLADTSHHVAITDDNIIHWLLSQDYRDRPWVLMTPLGQFRSPRLHERWIVPRRDSDRNDVFWLSKILWHSDEDGWVAEYTERLPT